MSRHSDQDAAGPPTAGVPAALPVTFRPLMTRTVLLVSGGVVFAVLALIAFLLPAGGAVAWGVGDRAAIAGCGLLIWAALAVLSRPRVVADPTGVTVVNLTRKRRLAWAEIVRVNLRSGDPWVILDLTDGSTLAVMGIQPGLARQQALSDAQALRALVETHGTASGPPGDDSR